MCAQCPPINVFHFDYWLIILIVTYWLLWVNFASLFHQVGVFPFWVKVCEKLYADLKSSFWCYHINAGGPAVNGHTQMKRVT